jgi:hypothetical protein
MSIKAKLEKILARTPTLKIVLSPHCIEVLEGYSRFEHVIGEGYIKLGLDPARKSWLEKIYLQAITGYDNLQPLQVVQRDVLELLPLLDLNKKVNIIRSGAGHDLVFDERSVLMLYKNLHIGSGNTRHEFEVFLRYGANVHLTASLVNDADTMIDNILPAGFTLEKKLKIEFALEDIGAKGEVSSIPDLAMYADIDWMKQLPDPDTGEMKKVYLFADASKSRTPITFDSKFVENVSTLRDSKVIKQQLSQFIHNRGLLFLDAFDNLSHLPEMDRMKMVTDHIPQLMQHYVMLPANFNMQDVDISLFVTNAKELSRSSFTPQLEAIGLKTDDEAFQLFMTAMDSHIDNHFGGGKFLFMSDMEHPKL